MGSAAHKNLSGIHNCCIDNKEAADKMVSVENTTLSTGEAKMIKTPERILTAETSLSELFGMGTIKVRGVQYAPVKLNRFSVDYKSPKGKAFSAIWIHAKPAGRDAVNNFEMVNRSSLHAVLFSIIDGEVRDMEQVR